MSTNSFFNKVIALLVIIGFIFTGNVYALRPPSQFDPGLVEEVNEALKGVDQEDATDTDESARGAADDSPRKQELSRILGKIQEAVKGAVQLLNTEEVNTITGESVEQVLQELRSVVSTEQELSRFSIGAPSVRLYPNRPDNAVLALLLEMPKLRLAFGEINTGIQKRDNALQGLQRNLDDLDSNLNIARMRIYALVTAMAALEAWEPEEGARNVAADDRGEAGRTMKPGIIPSLYEVLSKEDNLKVDIAVSPENVGALLGNPGQLIREAARLYREEGQLLLSEIIDGFHLVGQGPDGRSLLGKILDSPENKNREIRFVISEVIPVEMQAARYRDGANESIVIAISYDYWNALKKLEEYGKERSLQVADARTYLFIERILHELGGHKDTFVLNQALIEEETGAIMLDYKIWEAACDAEEIEKIFAALEKTDRGKEIKKAITAKFNVHVPTKRTEPKISPSSDEDGIYSDREVSLNKYEVFAALQKIASGGFTTAGQAMLAFSSYPKEMAEVLMDIWHQQNALGTGFRLTDGLLETAFHPIAGSVVGGSSGQEIYGRTWAPPAVGNLQQVQEGKAEGEIIKRLTDDFIGHIEAGTLQDYTPQLTNIAEQDSMTIEGALEDITNAALLQILEDTERSATTYFDITTNGISILAWTLPVESVSILLRLGWIRFNKSYFPSKSEFFHIAFDSKINAVAYDADFVLDKSEDPTVISQEFIDAVNELDSDKEVYVMATSSDDMGTLLASLEKIRDEFEGERKIYVALLNTDDHGIEQWSGLLGEENLIDLGTVSIPTLAENIDVLKALAAAK